MNEIFDDSDAEPEIQVDIRIFQRNRRQYVTTIEGLGHTDLDVKKLKKYMTKEFTCGGSIVNDNGNKIISLQGDQRDRVKNFLIREKILSLSQIKIHGF